MEKDYYIIGTQNEHNARTIADAIPVQFSMEISKSQVDLQERKEEYCIVLHNVTPDLHKRIREFAHGINWGLNFERGFLSQYLPKELR